MKFDWDEKKRLQNLRKHGLDFGDAAEVFKEETATIPDDRFDYGEDRFITFGLLRGIVVAVVHTEADKLVRVISFRKAVPNEERYYYESIRN
jgi:uncharacterized DUF497 family protein